MNTSCWMISEAAQGWSLEKTCPKKLPVVTYRENINFNFQRQKKTMGNWKLEIAKMVIYMAFPVTSFYVYHQVVTLSTNLHY